jgi:excisionase family DNA binding protein
VAKYVTIEQAAKMLGKSVEQVREMMNAGKLRGMMADGTFKFKEEDIAALAGGKPKEDTLMSIDGDALFAEGGSAQSADAAAETWIAADMENVFESEDFSLDGSGAKPAGEEIQPAPLALSPESDDTSLGAVLMEEEGAAVTPAGDEPIISIDPASGIATIAAPTPGISRTHMIVVSEPEPRHKAFTPLLVISVIVLGFALYGAASAMMSVTGSMDVAVQNLSYLVGGAVLVTIIAFVVGLVLDKQKAASEAAAARLGRR